MQNKICIQSINSVYSKEKKKFVLPLYSYNDLIKNYVISLNFRREKSNTSRGIRGEYFIQNCGGTFVDFVGEFKSINYPGTYPFDTYCNWKLILSDTTTNYKLTFLEFDIGDNCDEDYFYVRIFVYLYIPFFVTRSDRFFQFLD